MTGIPNFPNYNVNLRFDLVVFLSEHFKFLFRSFKWEISLSNNKMINKFKI